MPSEPRRVVGHRSRWVSAAAAVALVGSTFGPARLAAGQAAATAASQPTDDQSSGPAKQPVRRGIPGVFVMDADGSNARPLVKIKGARWHGSPSWSRDGNWVAFDSTPAGHQRAEVYLYAVGGPDKGTLRNLGPGNCPTLSPDGRAVAFCLMAGNAAAGEAGVYLMKPDGSDRRRLCDGDHPKWSPDGKRLLVTHDDQNPGAIDEVVVETGKVTRVLDTAYAEVPGAAYSPDGRKVAFIGFADRNLSRAELVVFDLPAAGGARAGGAAPATKVLHAGKIGWIPNWSPDGRRLAFVSWEKKGGTEYDVTHLIDVDGKSPPQRLKDQDGHGTRTSEAEWSADGKSIVFSSDREFPADKLADRPDPPAAGL